MKPTTARTLKYLREQGLTADVTEKWVGGFGKPEDKGGEKFKRGFRRDLFNWMDIIAFDDRQTIGVQTTSGSHHAEHIAKIQSLPDFHRWIAGPGRQAWLVSWTKRKVKPHPKAKGRMTWVPRVVFLSAF